MDEAEIIQRHYIQETNRKSVKNYFQALNNKNWGALQSYFFVTNNQVYTRDSQNHLFDLLQLTNKDWLSLRISANRVYEKFTEFTKSLKQTTDNKTKILTIDGAESSVEEGWKSIDLSVLELMDMLKTMNQKTHVEILHILADGDLVNCLVVTTELDPKSNVEITYEGNYYFYMKDGKVAFSVHMPHLLSGLMQLGKVISESKEDQVKEYIASLRAIGLIEK